MAPWLAPHLSVEMSFEEFQTNRDPVLETALAFSDNDFILDPMAYFTELYMTGQIEKIPVEAQKIGE